MLGIHVSKSPKWKHRTYATLEDGIRDVVINNDLNAVAIFTHGPRNLHKNNVNTQEVRAICAGIHLSIHSNYLSTCVWQKHQKKYVDNILDMLLYANELGAHNLVVHLPTDGVHNVVTSMVVLNEAYIKLDNPVATTLLLEQPATKKTIFNSVATLHTLCQHIEAIPNMRLPWGLCIDTSHLWSSGVDLSTPTAWMDWLDSDTYVSGKIQLIHLNAGLQKHFNTGKDIHIMPLTHEDSIWGHSTSASLRSIIMYAKERGIPLICEVNRGDEHEVIRAFGMLKAMLQ